MQTEGRKKVAQLELYLVVHHVEAFFCTQVYWLDSIIIRGPNSGFKIFIICLIQDMTHVERLKICSRNFPEIVRSIST